jgi:translation initiation factor eIF-2B subunit alpha
MESARWLMYQILIHSYSRTVLDTIIKAHKQHKRISVYVTEARPGCLG